MDKIKNKFWIIIKHSKGEMNGNKLTTSEDIKNALLGTLKFEIFEASWKELKIEKLLWIFKTDLRILLSHLAMSAEGELTKETTGRIGLFNLWILGKWYRRGMAGFIGIRKNLGVLKNIKVWLISSKRCFKKFKKDGRGFLVNISKSLLFRKDKTLSM